MAETAPKRGRKGDHLISSSRIIRVSHATGGKDRHCKVLTTRGPRDRRVRLSVPTAVQLYDLQDRLGLDQPSKAVDWLIAAAAAAIAHLPSLPAIEFSPTSGTSKGPDISPSQSEIHLATPTADYFRSPGLDRGLEREALQSNAESYLAQCGHYHYHCHHHHLPTVSSTLPLLFGSSEEYQLPGGFDGRLQLCHGEGNWPRSFVLRGEGEE